MAIIIPGPLAEEARGKVGGLVFSRNKGGQYVKGFAAPTNPSTSLQVEVRSQWATLTNAWSDILTPALRLAWDDLAAASPVLNSLGQSILLSGLNWYIRFNQSRLLSNAVRLDTAPATVVKTAADPAFAIDDIDPGAPSFDIAFDDTLSWVNSNENQMLVFQGQGQSTGRNTFDGPYRILGVILGDGAAPPTSPVAFASPVWTLASPSKSWAAAIITEGGVGAKMPSARFFAGPFQI